MILCTLFPTLPAETASQFHWKLITRKHRSREQRIFSTEIKIFFHKEAAVLFIILLYCLLSLKKENALFLSHPPPNSTPSLKDEENWRWACVTVSTILKCDSNVNLANLHFSL